MNIPLFLVDIRHTFCYIFLCNLNPEAGFIDVVVVSSPIQTSALHAALHRCLWTPGALLGLDRLP
jgi:hypothetical protein